MTWYTHVAAGKCIGKVNGAKRNEAFQCGAGSQSTNISVNQFAGFDLKFSNGKIAVTG